MKIKTWPPLDPENFFHRWMPGLVPMGQVPGNVRIGEQGEVIYELWMLAACWRHWHRIPWKSVEAFRKRRANGAKWKKKGSPVDVFSGTEMQGSHRWFDSRQLLPRFSMGVICPTHHGSLLFAGSMEFARSTQARSAVLIGWLSGRPKRSGALSRDVRGLPHTSAAGFTTRLYYIYI